MEFSSQIKEDQNWNAGGNLSLVDLINMAGRESRQVFAKEIDGVLEITFGSQLLNEEIQTFRVKPLYESASAIDEA